MSSPVFTTNRRLAVDLPFERMLKLRDAPEVPTLRKAVLGPQRRVYHVRFSWYDNEGTCRDNFVQVFREVWHVPEDQYPLLSWKEKSARNCSLMHKILANVDLAFEHGQASTRGMQTTTSGYRELVGELQPGDVVSICYLREPRLLVGAKSVQLFDDGGEQVSMGNELVVECGLQVIR